MAKWRMVLLLILGVTILGVGVVYAHERMPLLFEYYLESNAVVGSLPCGQAIMQIWVNDNGQRVVAWILRWGNVWGILALVFPHDGSYTAHVDWNFDGWVDRVYIGKSGEGSAADFYRRVKGCEGVDGFG